MQRVRAWWILGLLSEVTVLAALADLGGLRAGGWVAGLATAVVVNLLFGRALRRAGAAGPRPADWITLARATLAGAVTAVVADSFGGRVALSGLVALSAAALALDGFDGYVARRTGTASPLGARFDMEVDAFLILVLSVYAARGFGGWVLAIGAARYALLVAGWLLPWLCRPVPARYWRKVVAATQGIVLTAAAAGVLPHAVAEVGLAVALGLLAESFGHDVWWLARRRREDARRAATRRAAAPARMATSAHG